MYPLVCLLALVSTWGMLAWLQDGSRKGFRWFAGAGLALIYTHFIGALLLAAHLGVLLFGGWKRRDLGRGVRVWLAVLVVGFIPWLPFFLKALATTRGYGAEGSVSRLA